MGLVGIQHQLSLLLHLDDKKLAAMLYIKWLTESSNFAYDQGGVPVLKSQEYPDTLKAFDGIDLVEDAPAPAELADLATEVRRHPQLRPMQCSSRPRCRPESRRR